MTPTPVAAPRATGGPRPRRWTSAALALAAAVAMLAAGCGGTDTAATQAHPGASPAVQRASLTTLDGTTVTVPGSKPAALFFFSVSCGECIDGATSLAEAATALGDKADFLAVDMDPSESPQLIREFLDYIKAPQLPVAIDTGAVLTRRFQVAALSTLIVVNPSGTVTYRATDPTANQIKAELAKLGAQ